MKILSLFPLFIRHEFCSVGVKARKYQCINNVVSVPKRCQNPNVIERIGMNAMNILVTGAAGFIGFHLTKRLLALDNKVIGVDNINDYYDVF